MYTEGLYLLMVGYSTLEISKAAEPVQLDAIKSRFPELTEFRDTFGSLPDMLNGIDIKADSTLSPDTVSFQLKTRHKAKDDICLPIKVLLGKEKAALGYCYVTDDGEKIPFVLNFKSADYFVVSLSPKGTPQIYSTSAIYRAFLRHGQFSPDEVTIKDSYNRVDISERLLFISPRLLFQMLLYDFIITATGEEGIVAVVDRPEQLSKSITEYYARVNPFTYYD